MAKTEIGRFGNLNGNYNYLTDTYGMAIGRYDAGRPHMLYDSSTGKLSFKVYETEYMSFEYNSGNPRVFLGNSINSVELVTSGLNVGNTGKISGGNVIYGLGDGFWMGYNDSAYKVYIGNGTNSLRYDGTDLKLTGAFMGGKTSYADTTAGFWLGKDTDYKLYIGNDTEYIKWDGTNLSITGGLTTDSVDVGTTGYLRGGQTDYDTGIGFWLGYKDGTHKLSIGSSTGKKLLWDGTNLSCALAETAIGTDGILHAKGAVISGTLTATAGFIGGPTGWVIATGKITSTGIGLATAAGDDTYAIWAGDDTPASAEFYVKHDGTLKSTAGTIGGWTIGAASLTAGTGENGVGFDVTGGATPVIYAGNTTPANAEFRVYANGNLNASSATLSGNVTATGGSIGGWSISGNTMVSAGTSITLDAGNNVIYVGDLHFHGSPAEIHSNDYVSGISGFKLNADYLEVNNINARGMIRTACFQKDLLSVVGGTVMILPGDVLAADMTALNASTMVASGTHTFEQFDIVRIKDGTDDEWLYITDASGAPTYVVQRDMAAAYDTNANPAWKKGSTIVSYQGWSDGGLQLTSSLTNAPYLSIFVRPASTTYPYSVGGLIEKVRLGNLTGIADTSGYGLWTDNCYLTGRLQTGSGNKKIVIDSSDNTLKFYNSTGALKLMLDEGFGDPNTSGIIMDDGIILISGTYTGYGPITNYNRTFIDDQGIECGKVYVVREDQENGSDTEETRYGGKFSCIPGSATTTNRLVTRIGVMGIAEPGVGITDGNYYGVYGYCFPSVTATGRHAGIYGVGTDYGYSGYFTGGSIYAKDDLIVSGTITINTGANLRSATLSLATLGTSSVTYTIPDKGASATFDLTVPSDARLKENIVPTKFGLNTINAVRIVDFNFIGTDKERTGAIAQEVKEVYPQIVNENGDGNLSIEYKEFIPLLIKSVQQLSAKIDKLEKENKDLKKQIHGLTLYR